jgi:hypothetical protein
VHPLSEDPALRTVAREVGWQRIERMSVVAFAVQTIPVTRHAVLHVHARSVGQVRLVRPAVMQWVLEPLEAQRFAPERDLAGRRRVHGTE